MVKNIKTYLVVLVLTILLTCISTATAFEDNFQNHPSDDYAQGTEENIWQARWSHSGSLTIVPYTATYNKVSYLTASNVGYMNGYGYMGNAYSDETTYLSFVLRDSYQVSSGPGWYISFYDKYNVKHSDALLPRGTIQNINNDDLYEIVYDSVSNNIYLYLNGVLSGDIGNCYQSFHYYEIQIGPGRSDGSAPIARMWMDCFSTDGYTIGIGTSESPAESVNPNSNDEIDVDWTVNTVDPYGSWNDTEVYQIVVTWLDTEQTVNTTTVNTSKPAGIEIYNMSKLFGLTDYGTYKFELTMDGTVKETEYLAYTPIGASGTLYWDEPSYVAYQTGTATYQYGSFDPANHNYYIKTYNINGGLVDTQTLSAISGSVDVTFSAWDQSSYYSLLTVQSKAGGEEYSLAFDTFDITEEVLITGTTYDVTNNLTLPITHINFTQSTVWYNTTSDVNSSYNLYSLSVNSQIVSNASKTNYTHEAFSWTPLTSKMYDIDLYLFQSNITKTTHVIEGVVMDDMLYQGVGSEAVVNIWNSTWNTSTTTNWLGYYQTENLHCDSTNATNEIFNSGTYEDVVQLDNTSIVSGSQIVKNVTGTTTYTNVTDYTMDYLNGTIQVHSGGAMAASTDYHVNYSYYIPTEYTVNATCPGYEDSEDYTVTVNSWSIQNILMKGIYKLNVTAINAVTGATMQEFTCTVDGQTTDVTNGTAKFYKNYGLYTVSASKEDYYSDSENVMMDRHRDVQLSLTPVDSEYYPSHYVEFVVCSIWGKKFPNVAVNVYNSTDTSGSSMLNGTTGTDGSITFRLDQNVQYTITFIGAEITDKTVTLYPKNEKYFILVSYEAPELLDQGEFEYDNVIVSVVSYDNNGTIHVSYLDKLDNTTALTFFVNQTNMSDIYNQTVIHSATGFGDMSNATYIFTLTNYTNQEYIVSVQFTHDNFGDRKYDFGVSFGNAMEVLNKIFSPFVKGMLAIFLLIFIALLFGVRSAEQGGLIVAVFAAILHGMGWFAYFGRPAILWLAISLAIIMMIAANISKGSKDEGF